MQSNLKLIFKDEFKYKKPDKNISYKPLNDDMFKTGQPFTITRSSIINPEDDMNPELVKIEAESMPF